MSHFNPAEPRDRGGKWSKGTSDLEKLMRGAPVPSAAGRSQAASDIAQRQIQSKVELLRSAQVRIRKAIDTPPENMSPDEIDQATRIISALTSADVKDFVQQAVGHVPTPILKEAHAKVEQLRNDMHKEFKKDAIAKLAVGIAAILGAIGVSILTGGVAIPAAMALLIEHIPDLFHELGSFRSDYGPLREAKAKGKVHK